MQKSSSTSILEEPVALRSLLRRLVFAEEQFDDANLEQAQLYLTAARYRVQRMRYRFRLTAKLEVLQSEVALRERGKKHDRKKSLTERGISDIVTTDSRVVRLRRKTERAYVLEEFSKLLLEAFRQRQSTLKIVSDNRTAEISNQLRQAKNRIAMDDLHRRADRVRRRSQEGD